MNNTRKKSSLMVRLVAVLAVTMMFTMCFVGGTFAKYTSSATGDDSATVAKWSFKVGGTDIATSDTFTFTEANSYFDINSIGDETITIQPVMEKKPMDFAASIMSLMVFSPSLHNVGSPPSRSMKREPSA